MKNDPAVPLSGLKAKVALARRQGRPNDSSLASISRFILIITDGNAAWKAAFGGFRIGRRYASHARVDVKSLHARSES